MTKKGMNEMAWRILLWLSEMERNEQRRHFYLAQRQQQNFTSMKP